MKNAMFALLTGLVLSPLPAAAQPDASQRLAVLKAIFPNAAITAASPSSPTLPTRSANSHPLPDAMANADNWRIVASLTGQDERCLASDVTQDKKLANTRSLRLRLDPWPGSASDRLATVQYDFPAANPPGACTSIAHLFHLRQDGGNWRILAHHDFETTHHGGLQRIEFLDVSNDGKPELLVESDLGGAGFYVSQLTIFGLAQGRFTAWLRQPAYQSEASGEESTQALDIAAARRKQGREFCFTKTILATNGVRLARSKTSHPCYPRQT